MQSSNIPAKIPLPFAYAAGPSYINTIPTASQIGITNGKASLTDGFPPLTFQALSAGGVPPFGADFNGILNEITSIQQWQQAGGYFPFDSAFSTAIGGYPAGAVVQSSTLNGFWLSRTNNNTTDPDSVSSANWVPVSPFWNIPTYGLSGTSVTISLTDAACAIIKVTGTLTQACNVILPTFIGSWIIQNNTTGAYTVQVKTASGTGVNVAQGQSTYVYGDSTNIYYADSAKVASFNGRVGAITLSSLDVTTALGFTPLQYGLGIGQTWQNVLSSRAAGVTYTNSTPRPICVVISSSVTRNNAVSIYVDGINVAQGVFNSTSDSQPGGDNVTAIVPSGSTYYLSTYYSLQIWVELR